MKNCIDERDSINLFTLWDRPNQEVYDHSGPNFHLLLDLVDLSKNIDDHNEPYLLLDVPYRAEPHLSFLQSWSNCQKFSMLVTLFYPCSIPGLY